MDPFTTSAVIAGGASLLGTGASIISNGNMNKKNRQWQEKMYAQQLADERANWNMQNQYNEDMYNKYQSPLAQSQQMMAAGINPDLQDISVGSVPQAGDVGSSSVPSVSGQTPFDFIGAFSNLFELFQDMRSKQLDNDLKQEQIDSLGRSRAMDYLVKSYQPRMFEDGLVSVSGSTPTDKQLFAMFKRQGLSRRAARAAVDYVSRADLRDVKSEYYRRESSSDEQRSKSIGFKADPHYSSFDDLMENSLGDFLKELDNFDRLTRSSQSSKFRYDRDYYNASNGAADASLDFRSKQQRYDINEASSASDRELNSWLNGIDNVFVRMLFRNLIRGAQNRFNTR